MPINIDKYLYVKYSQCNCLDLIIKIYHEEYGIDISSLKTKILIPSQFVKIKSPVEGAIIVLYRKDCTKHVGIYTAGSVIHSLEDYGVKMDSLPMLTSLGWAVKSIYITEEMKKKY